MKTIESIEDQQIAAQTEARANIIGAVDVQAQADIAQAQADKRDAALREEQARFALEQATATLVDLQTQWSSAVHQQHVEAFEDAKTRLAQTAVEVEVATESLSDVMDKFRANIREVRVAAIEAGISNFPFQRAQVLAEDWLRDRVFNTTTRIPRRLAKPFGEIMRDFLTHRNNGMDGSEESHGHWSL